MKRKFLSAILAAALFATATVANVSAATVDETPTITVEGRTVRFPDQKPIIKNDRTLVPIRFIAESLGYDVEWNKDDHTAIIDDSRVVLFIGTNQAILDGVQTELDVASELIADRTMVPLRVVAETLGCTVDWFGTNNTVLINSRDDDGGEMSVFDRFKQSGLFRSYSTTSTEYLVWRKNYTSLTAASNPDNYDSWWIERPKDTSNLTNKHLDCTIAPS